MKSAKAEGLVLRAAIYARKSTDEGDRSQEAKSVERQKEHARKFIASRGWSLSDAHVFEDDGKSGAEFKKREGLLRLLNAVRDVDVIVMSELSRLGRDQIQTAQCLAQIEAAGVEVWFYLTGEKLKFETAVDRFLVNAHSFAAELEREKASQRARDALIKRARSGFVTGGECYGYSRVRVNSHVEHRINEAEADVVRAIFRMYADGHGYDTIAKTLNLDPDPRYVALNKRYVGGRRVPSPMAGKRHTGTWAVTALHAMLRRERYIGQLVFGKHRNVVRNGNADAREPQDPSEWLRVERPELRIVPQDLWDAVQAKLATNGRTLPGRAGRAGESRWLLSGIARCGECGKSMIIVSGGARRHYGCSYHMSRGSVACRNDQVIHVPDLDRTVLDAVVETAMTPEVVRRIAAEAWKVLRAPAKQQRDPRQALDARIRDAERKLRNLVQVAAAGDRAPETVLAAIREHEAELRALKAQRAETAAVANAATNEVALRRHIERVVSRWRERLTKDVATARQALRALLAGGTLVAKVTERGYAVQGETVVGALLGSHAVTVASPRGFEPRLPP